MIILNNLKNEWKKWKRSQFLRINVALRRSVVHKWRHSFTGLEEVTDYILQNTDKEGLYIFMTSFLYDIFSSIQAENTKDTVNWRLRMSTC